MARAAWWHSDECAELAAGSGHLGHEPCRRALALLERLYARGAEVEADSAATFHVERSLTTMTEAILYATPTEKLLDGRGQ